MFTKYGYTSIGVVTFISFLIILASFFVHNNAGKIILIITAAMILILTLNFFRDPERNTPAGDNIIISPADGKVISIKSGVSNYFVGEKVHLISIFMSPLNVHVNRIPSSGKVEHLKYFKGKFQAAFEESAAEENERMETGLNTRHGKILFTQVAGFLARRIVNELKVGDSVKAGSRFGMIKFGSRVDVFVPAGFVPKVKMNENVKAGETILFEIIN